MVTGGVVTVGLAIAGEPLIGHLRPHPTTLDTPNQTSFQALYDGELHHARRG
jgi:hypothetical protein